VWIAEEAGPSWLWPALIVAVAIAALHLVSQLEAAHRSTERPRAADVVLLHANGLGLYGLLYLLLESHGATALAGTAAALPRQRRLLSGRGESRGYCHFGAVAARCRHRRGALDRRRLDARRPVVETQRSPSVANRPQWLRLGAVC
jgi:hypothetical protein